jgi:hypothetical protein
VFLLQVSHLLRCSPRYLTSFSLGGDGLCVVYMDRGAHFPSCGECGVGRYVCRWVVRWVGKKVYRQTDSRTDLWID